jgi:SAM-dependent methyltransferase
MSSTPPWETPERETFRATFDDDAEAYERSRPVAPDDVFDELVDLAHLEPGSRVVEIGPGTGQATRPLAERGLRVLALELGPHLAARARANLSPFPDVEIRTTSFEAWDPGDDRYDAVFACNSFHWIDPDTRFQRAAAALRPGGHLAVLSTPWVIPDDAQRFWWDIQDDWAAVGEDRVDPATAHPDRVEDLRPAVVASRSFDEPTIRRRLFEVRFTADEYALNLSTQSGVKALPPSAQADLVERVRQRVLAGGGTVTAHLLAMLTVAPVRDR